MTYHIIKSFLAGFLISMPLGPVSLMIIRRTANKNFKSGFYSALGAISGDTIYAVLAGFGLTYVLNFLRHHQNTIQIIGAIVLFFIGLYFYRYNPLKNLHKTHKHDHNQVQHYFTTLLLAFSNPLIMLAYIGIFAGSGIVFSVDEPAEFLTLIGSFILGAFAWWMILTTTINAVRHHFNLKMLIWMNKLSGMSIMLFVVVSAIIILLKGSPKF